MVKSDASGGASGLQDGRQLTNGQLKVGPVICGVCGAEFRVPGDDDLDDEE